MEKNADKPLGKYLECQVTFVSYNYRLRFFICQLKCILNNLIRIIIRIKSILRNNWPYLFYEHLTKIFPKEGHSHMASP